MVADARSAGPARADVTRDDAALDAVVLDRAAYLRAVLDRNPTLEAARAGWRAALARVRGSGSLEDPTVSLAIAPLSIGATDAPLGWQASISQRFPWPEKLSLDVAIAKDDARAARDDFETTKLDLALAAAALYDAYFVAVRSLDVNGEQARLVRDLKDAALGQLAAGRGSTEDALAADMELAHIEHESLVLDSDRRVLVAQMNELLHRPAELPLPRPPETLEVGAEPRASDARRRSELDAASDRERAADERVRRARRDWFPDLTISTSYDSMWSAPEHRWMVGLSFDLPIEPARREGGVEAAVAERDRARSEREKISDHVSTEVAVARERWREAVHVLELYQSRLLPIARDTVAAARAGYVASRNDFATLIAAEKNLRSTALGEATARADVDRRAAELRRAQGELP